MAGPHDDPKQHVPEHRRADVRRIVAIGRSRGVELGEAQAMAAWELVSEALCAGWLLLPDDDDRVWRDIEAQWRTLRATLAESGAPASAPATAAGVRLGHVELHCSDTARALAFYRDVLGAALVADQPGGFRWLTLGSVEILLRPGAPGPRPERYADAGSGLVLYCEDLPATLQRLTARGLRVDGDDGGCPTFTDPDGHWFQLVDPRDHAP